MRHNRRHFTRTRSSRRRSLRGTCPCPLAGSPSPHTESPAGGTSRTRRPEAGQRPGSSADDLSPLKLKGPAAAGRPLATGTTSPVTREQANREAAVPPLGLRPFGRETSRHVGRGSGRRGGERSHGLVTSCRLCRWGNADIGTFRVLGSPFSVKVAPQFAGFYLPTLGTQRKRPIWPGLLRAANLAGLVLRELLGVLNRASVSLAVSCGCSVLGMLVVGRGVQLLSVLILLSRNFRAEGLYISSLGVFISYLPSHFMRLSMDASGYFSTWHAAAFYLAFGGYSRSSYCHGNTPV